MDWMVKNTSKAFSKSIYLIGKLTVVFQKETKISLRLTGARNLIKRVISSRSFYYLNLNHQREINSNLTTSTKINYGAYDYQGHYIYPSPTNSFVEKGKANWLGINYGLDYTGIDQHRIIAGIEAQKNLNLLQKNSDGSLNDNHHYLNGAVYVQDQWRINSNLIQYVGLRLDEVNNELTASPKWSMVGNLGFDTHFRLSAARSFRPASVYERFYQDGGLFLSNPNLKNEYLSNLEFNLEHAFSSKLIASTTLYHYKVENLITQSYVDGHYQFLNSPAQEADGIEMGAKLFLDNLRIQLNVAYQKMDSENNSKPFNSPALLGKILIDQEIPSANLVMGFNLQSSAKVYDVNDQKISGYTTSNLVFSQREPSKIGKISLGIYNLFNQIYFTPTSQSIADHRIQQDGRAVKLSWEIKF